jgi:hypothetical protein
MEARKSPPRGARPASEDREAERLLRSVLEGTAARSGEDFMRALVRSLAQVLEVRYAFISEFPAAGSDIARVLVFWKDGALAPPFDYRLAGTPCAEVAAHAEFLMPAAIRQRFPGDARLEALGAECFFGMRLHDAAGAPLGLLAIADVRALDREKIARIVMGIFAARAGVELERLRAGAILAENEARLRTMAELSRHSELALQTSDQRAALPGAGGAVLRLVLADGRGAPRQRS